MRATKKWKTCLSCGEVETYETPYKQGQRICNKCSDLTLAFTSKAEAILHFGFKGIYNYGGLWHSLDEPLTEIDRNVTIDIRVLALQVLKQAISDAVNLAKDKKSVAAKKEALLFLRGGGEWREARKTWCKMAGVNPHRLQGESRERLGRFIRFREYLSLKQKEFQGCEYE